MAALTDAQAKLVWEEWLASEMRSHYFGDLSGTYTNRQRIANWLGLLLSSGAAFAFIGSWLPQGSLAALALLVAGVNLYSLVMQNHKAAADCADLHAKWNRLAREYAELWNTWYSADASARLAATEERATEASKAGLQYGRDRRRLERWEERVIEQRVRPAA